MYRRITSSSTTVKSDGKEDIQDKKNVLISNLVVILSEPYQLSDFLQAERRPVKNEKSND